VGQALEYGCPHLDGVRLCLRQIMHPDMAIPTLDLTQHPQLSIVMELPDLGRYEQLLAGGR
jgi:hypothetical protein